MSMKNMNKMKKAGAFVLTAAVLGSTQVLSGTGLMAAQAAQNTSPVTEYDEATLALFKDNVLEYWEIPGLIERYNPTFVNQLDSYYYNPDGVTGLSKDQLEYMAYELRAAADELEEELEDYEDEFSAKVKKEYKDNIRSLKKFAANLENAAEGKETVDSTMVASIKQMMGSGQSSSEVLRTMKRTKNQLIANISAKMRNYQILTAQDEIQKKTLELAELNYQSAVRQQQLGMYSLENVLSVEDSLNSARAEANASAAALTEGKQSLILDLGWSYDGNPEILSVPEPDLAKIDGYDPETDMAAALSNNYDLVDLKLADSKELGGAVEKARQIKDQEEQVDMQLENLYQSVLQAKTSYSAAMNGWNAAEANKAQADRKYQLGMISRQEYLSAEITWLGVKAAKEQAAMNLISAMETYEWAVKGMMPETQM